ncbi:MAG: glycosyltransferase family 39 protein [Burkholderiaceae bacterium]|nr:glycosyltransferase family 39 protein [Burkholderiaceae bacterium]
MPVSSSYPARFTLPTRQVVLFLLLMVALWSVLMAVSHKAPDLDGMEELVWASSLELGYSKHPPFPSWIMYGLTQIFGRPIWLTFFAGQLFSALGLWFVWKLGREMTTPAQAFMAMLLVSTIAYFSLRGTIYNHNTAQLWSIAAATWLFYRALRYQRASSWLWLGAVSAIAMLTKYSALIQFAAFFLFMLRAGSLKQSATFKGIGLALLSFLIVASPHIYWLWQHDFQPLLYADKSLETATRLEALGHVWAFLIDQLGRLSPMLVAWLAWAYWMRKSPPSKTSPAGTVAQSAPRYGQEFSDFNRSFVLWVGLTPLLSTLVISLLLGTSLVASWASTFFILYGFYALWGMRGDEVQNLRRIAILVLSIHLLMAVGYAVARGPLAWYTGRDTRSMFPGPTISAAMTATWQRYVPDHPLTVVVSDTWLGGNIAVHAGRQAQVLINADFSESPWLNPATALDCGALVVFSRQTRGEPAPALLALQQNASWHGQLEIPWSRPSSPIIDLNWGVIAPGPNCKN